jgi:peroxiredoxin
MSALTTGKRAPDIQLPTTDGGQFSLPKALTCGPVLLVFFKISCPVCQFALPYVERLYRAAKGTNVTIVGISQNLKKDSEFFARQYGITYPIALDDPNSYPVSNAYGITSVPTMFYVNQDGEIEVSGVGWSKADMENIAKKVAAQAQLGPIAVIKPGEDVPAFRAG